jgi:hypothetical protein
MDLRAIVVGSVVTAAVVVVCWFGRLPAFVYLSVCLGPFVAGFLSRSRESKAFEGVAAIGAGYLLAIVALAVGHFVLFDALPLVWRADAAFTTLVLGAGAFILFVPVSCVLGAVMAAAGSFIRTQTGGSTVVR